MRVLLAILAALSLTWSSATSAHPNRGLCAGGEERALRAREREEAHGGPRLYAQARYLDPNTGRFLSLDPVQGSLAEPLSTQGFTYAHANPTRFTDPTGRCKMSTNGDDVTRLDCFAVFLDQYARADKLAHEAQAQGKTAEWAAANVAGGMTLAGLPAAVLGEAFIATPVNLISSVISVASLHTDGRNAERGWQLANDTVLAAATVLDPALLLARAEESLAAKATTKAVSRDFANYGVEFIDEGAYGSQSLASNYGSGPAQLDLFGTPQFQPIRSVPEQLELGLAPLTPRAIQQPLEGAALPGIPGGWRWTRNKGGNPWSKEVAERLRAVLPQQNILHGIERRNANGDWIEIDIETNWAILEVKGDMGNDLPRQLSPMRIDSGLNPTNKPRIGVTRPRKSPHPNDRVDVEAEGGLIAGPSDWKDLLEILR